MGKTGRARRFCDSKCKQYHTNHVKHFTQLDSALADMEYCLTLGDKGLRMWAAEYCVDSKGAFRRKILEPLFGLSTGLTNITNAINKAVADWPDTELLKPNLAFRTWLQESTRTLCPICGEKYGKIHIEYGIWRTYCSETCCNKAKRSGGIVRETIQTVCMDRYGCLGANTPEIVEKRKASFLAKTGFENPMHVPGNLQRAMETRKANGHDKISAPELEIKEFIESLGLKCVHSDWAILRGKQIDLYVPEKRLAIEYNGCFFHSEGNGGEAFAKKRHLEKTEACEAKGIQLLHIWEDEWAVSKESVLDTVQKLLNGEPLFTSDCNTVVIDRCKVARHSNWFLENGFVEVSVSEPRTFFTRGARDRITEEERIDGVEYNRIFDCGTITYTKEKAL